MVTDKMETGKTIGKIEKGEILKRIWSFCSEKGEKNWMLNA